MRIQHNIMAMNAYRNYTNNTSALSSNLEKLSSGYKINRAGDDAAGLAISEKMRAQITGLDAAQKNVKDGISLVKTAEGAMQEVQDMLNRMVYLANQSANGTYDNDVDRANLQKEVDSLRSEIDRIADSANFNGIQLLDGSLSDGSVKAAYQKLDAAGIKGLLLPEAAGGTAGVAGTNTLLEADSKTNQLPTFSVDLDGMSHVVEDPGADDFTLEVGGQTVNATGDVQNLAKGDKLDAKALAALYDGSTVTLDGVAYTAKVEGSKIVFTADKAADKDINAHYDVSFEGVTGNTVAATAAVYTTGALTQGATTGGQAATVTIEYTDADGKTQQKDVTFNSGTSATDTFNALKTAIEADADLKDLFTVGGSDAAGMTLTAKTAGADAPAVTNITVKTPGGDTVAIAAGNAVDGADAYTTGTSGTINVGTVNVVATKAGAKDQLANTVLDLAGKMTDGTQVTLGDTTYTFAVGKDSVFAGAENVIDLTHLTGEEADFDELAASKLTEAAKDNGIFSVGHKAGDGGKISLQQLQAAKDSTDMTTMDKLASYIGVSTVDAAKGDPIMGTGLTLQIGDTSDAWNQLKVSVEDMHCAALGIANVDISTQDGAAEAVNVIKEAINSVSMTRGTLGATQNRLEHTQNNLSVMEENITDAESTIRDTDVAEEMMSYTKNNILIQSAQAMLAQANQVPQGVLQLLQ